MLPKIKTSIKTSIKDSTESVLSGTTSPLNFRMNFDGGSRGNPGISGCGAVIYHDGDEIWSDSFFVGINATNNHAEYAGLILGLQQAIEMNVKSILVQGDSELIINQMTGKYRCHSANLIELYNKAKELEAKFTEIRFQHVLRNFNKRADQLSNIAIQKYIENVSIL